MATFFNALHLQCSKMTDVKCSAVVECGAVIIETAGLAKGGRNHIGRCSDH